MFLNNQNVFSLNNNQMTREPLSDRYDFPFQILIQYMQRLELKLTPDLRIISSHDSAPETKTNFLKFCNYTFKKVQTNYYIGINVFNIKDQINLWFCSRYNNLDRKNLQ